MSGRQSHASSTLLHLFFIAFSLAFIVPFLLVLSISFSHEETIRTLGYRLIPPEFTLDAYRYAFANPGRIQDAYIVTTLQSALGTFLSIVVMATCGYALSRRSFRYRGPITFIVFFTMLFSGGLVPLYIVVTQYLRLGNSFWVYIFPRLVSAFPIIIFRTFFQSIPESLPESAKIDGASEWTIFFRIIVPLSKPVVATLSLFGLIDRWNDWFTTLIYVRDTRLYTLQFLLQRILREAQFLRAIATELPLGMDIGQHDLPTESLRFAMLIIAAGPMLVVFPFFQKHFAKGLTIGAVKG